ncbi:arylsulfatase B-like isoform X1 [Schistocerca americana]|uniref:arylsulfatase B-like isoform X1 n=2 Tax=Schistocerca americana TaxID=7009 RepID=UPI001F4FAA75|nr:arylsulfatase B-like isoform X1 [Schistocerca americana]
MWVSGRLLCFTVLWNFISGTPEQPNIVIIVADDVGWNDVGFHGSDEIQTPNIDALAYQGVVLTRHYTLPSCTPSRSALLTGRYPITTGMQGYPLRAGESRGVPLSVQLLPEHFKRIGYATHAIGKWHIGSHKSNFTPTYRGFDSHFGYWYGYIGYHNHSIEQEVPNHQPIHGLDMHRGLSAAWDTKGTYATELFTREAVSIIQRHNASSPLLLYIGHLAPHSPLEVPDQAAADERFSHITDRERRIYAEMLWHLDVSVGEVIKALQQCNMLNNTVIVFISDNGGQPHGIHYNKASNWPLRGTKFTLFEGGVRTVAALWTSKLRQAGRVSDIFVHITDWLPTLYSAAGGNLSDLGPVDGVNLWPWLGASNSTHIPKGPPPRVGMLLNIDEILGLEAIIHGRWKLTRGSFHNGQYDSHSEQTSQQPNGADSIANALSGSAAHALASAGISGPTTKAQAFTVRSQATINCQKEMSFLPKNLTGTPLCSSNYCLFNIFEDPCEVEDIASSNPTIVTSLILELNKFRSRLVPQTNCPVDISSDPAQFNNTWHPWLD